MLFMIQSHGIEFQTLEPHCFPKVGQAAEMFALVGTM